MSQAINCSSCGAANQIPEGKDSMFCVFCGSSIIKIKQANDHADPTADPKIKNYLELAQNAMESSDFDEAIRYFNKVLENNPKISEAWFGKGYCSGWNGSLNSIKVDQMILNFNKALEYVSEDKLQELKINVAEAIDGCAFSIYNLSYNHTVEFAQVDGTYGEHLSRSTDIISALEFAHSMYPQSKAIIESILSISKNLLKPIGYTNYDNKSESYSLDGGSSKKIKNIYNKYFKLMEGIDPEYVKKIKKQEERVKNIKLIGLGVITLFIMLLFLKTCNKSSNLSNTENGSDVINSNTENGSDVINSNTEINSSIIDQNVTEPSQYDLLRDSVSVTTDPEGSTSYPDGSMPMNDSENEAVITAENASSTKMQSSKSSTKKYQVGDKLDGGIVFWVEHGLYGYTGEHGLIADTEDLGVMNWEDAIKACQNKGAGWHLPNANQELGKLRLKTDIVGGFARANYWSATESGYIGGNKAFTRNFHHYSEWDSSLNKDTKNYVRAVKAF
jgi:hypothetical protein